MSDNKLSKELKGLWLEFNRSIFNINKELNKMKYEEIYLCIKEQFSEFEASLFLISLEACFLEMLTRSNIIGISEKK